jgi:hypothetical protein
VEGEDEEFIRNLKDLSNMSGFNKLRNFLKRDWIGQDRAKWPAVV